MLTAFYMTRMMVMTFHGPNRTGEKEAHHLHEAPLTMTVPLLVLAALSLFGGWINVPEALHEGGSGSSARCPWRGLHTGSSPSSAGHRDRAEHVGPSPRSPRWAAARSPGRRSPP